MTRNRPPSPSPFTPLSSLRRAARIACALLGIVPLALPAGAQQWRSPLWGRDYVEIQKEGLESLSASKKSDLQAALGPDSLEYESFVAAYLPSSAKGASLAYLEGIGISLRHKADRWERLGGPSGGWRGEERSAWRKQGLPSRAVTGLYVARFAFPIRAEWLSGAKACGAELKAVLDSATVVLRTAAPKALPRCGGFRYLAWFDPFTTADRAEPALLAEEGDDGGGADTYSLQYFQGTPLAEVVASLPKGVRILDWDRSPRTGALVVQVAASRDDLLALLERGESLLAVAPNGESLPSDERQGQILAGNHTGSAVTATGYVAWLSGRGLGTASNQQTVALFDTGYDDGSAAGPHHLDLESPHRYLDGATYVGGAGLVDTAGHGTMVAGIVAGNGATGSTKTDPQGFYLGTGIAPQSRLVPVKIFHFDDTDSCAIQAIPAVSLIATLRSAFAFSRNSAGGSDKALLSNHSWNRGVSGSISYETSSQLFDEMVVDANGELGGAQPMTVVVSAGNAGAVSAAGCPGACSATAVLDTVRPPATAKNVIAVGATENYRPVAQAGQPPGGCGCWCSALAQDATDIRRLALISSKGRRFERYDAGDPPFSTPIYAHNVRIKPDLVAPGVRITSTVPEGVSSYQCTSALCAQFFPSTIPLSYHSYGQGTSFAAPAVTGAAALLRKLLLDGGIDPAPSLVKAALIATADDLGGFSEYNGDHRPSHLYGWGRVNVDRLTDSTPKVYVTERSAIAVSTGQDRSFAWTVDNGAKDTYLVLVWSDPPSTLGSSQVPLINDLRLTATEYAGGPFWSGNNFQENLQGGVEDGYSHHFVTHGDVPVDDGINTVEAIFIPANTYATGQSLTVKVTGVSVPAGPQTFSLYGYNLR